MSGIVEWQTLRCDCKNDLFLPLVKLQYKTGGGTTTVPAGHKCASCNAVVDNSYMIRLIENQKKRDEAARLLAEAAIDESSMTKKPQQGVPAARS